MSCQHCGWDGSDRKPPAVNLEDWPEGVPPPPPLPPFARHPEHSCPSPFKIGDEVFWTGEAGADLPPVQAVFLELTGFCGPQFVLKPTGWEIIRAAVPAVAKIRVEEELLLPEHRRVYPEFAVIEDHYKVLFKDLTLRKKWPVMTC